METPPVMQWDENIFGRMGARARADTLGARDWLLSHRRLSMGFIKRTHEPNPALLVGRVFGLLADEIEKGGRHAIELGCLYVIEDPKAPFGRCMKRKVMNALRRNAERIPAHFHQGLMDAYSRMDSLPYKPQEFKDLGRLVRKVQTVQGEQSA